MSDTPLTLSQGRSLESPERRGNRQVSSTIANSALDHFVPDPVASVLDFVRHSNRIGEQFFSNDRSVADWISLAESGSEIRSVIGSRQAPLILSRFASFLNAAGVIFGLIGQAWSILEAFISAANADRSVIKAIASSHAFGYWQFSHDPRIRNNKPHPPSMLLVHWRDLDRRREQIQRVTGRDTRGLTSTERQNIWRQAVQNSVVRFEQEFNSIDIRLIYLDIEERLPQVQVRQMPDDDCRQLLKTIVCRDFEGNPANAAYTHHLGLLSGSDDPNFRRVVGAMYSRYRYDPCIIGLY